MFPAAFDYARPRTLDEAIALVARHGEQSKLLAGGHSLIPAMKLRLAQPATVIDLGGIPDLRYIREAGGGIAIGAMATHFDIESSDVLRQKCPLLTEVAPHIGDVQVRNKGTIGGSLAHADPAADWPAAVLALDAELELAGPGGRRTIKAREFFVDMLQTALRPDEILCEIRVPRTGASVGYCKFPQKASGFALVGAAVVVDSSAKTVTVGMTGVAPRPYRAAAVEAALRGKAVSAATIDQASSLATDGIEPLGDIHASADYRAHLARIAVARALARATKR